MELILKRIAKKNKYTIGRLFVDGTYICDTIEDKDRGLDNTMSEAEIKSIKIPKQTAIPTGRYAVTMNVISPKFSLKPYYKNFCNGYLPRLLGVKGFDGILMHCGTTQDSSAGCIIVGYNTIVGSVTNSQIAFEKLMKKYLLPAKKRGENIFITIK